MTPIELLEARAALGGAIGMTLQEWRDLMAAIDALPAEERVPYEEVVFFLYQGKQVLVGIEPA